MNYETYGISHEKDNFYKIGEKNLFPISLLLLNSINIKNPFEEYLHTFLNYNNAKKLASNLKIPDLSLVIEKFNNHKAYNINPPEINLINPNIDDLHHWTPETFDEKLFKHNPLEKILSIQHYGVKFYEMLKIKNFNILNKDALPIDIETQIKINLSIDNSLDHNIEKTINEVVNIMKIKGIFVENYLFELSEYEPIILKI